jgi:hypothetical protein
MGYEILITRLLDPIRTSTPTREFRSRRTDHHTPGNFLDNQLQPAPLYA